MLFPSPFGVHVLKLREGELGSRVPLVSVPFRGSRSEMAGVLVYVALCLSFPSPFGVHVLKCYESGVASGKIPKVSVPFRGSRSEIKHGNRTD